MSDIPGRHTLLKSSIIMLPSPTLSLSKLLCTVILFCRHDSLSAICVSIMIILGSCDNINYELTSGCTILSIILTTPLCCVYIKSPCWKYVEYLCRRFELIKKSFLLFSPPETFCLSSDLITRPIFS